MKLKPERRESWGKLFPNDRIAVAIMIIEEQGFKGVPENETVLQHWKVLFGNKGKKEAVALLKRVQRYKNHDYEMFKRTFAQKYTQT